MNKQQLAAKMWESPNKLRSKIEANEYKDYICNQVLGTSLDLADEVKEGTELNFDDFSLLVNVVKE